jgi:hypothetical protein
MGVSFGEFGDLTVNKICHHRHPQNTNPCANPHHYMLVSLPFGSVRSNACSRKKENVIKSNKSHDMLLLHT